MASTARAVPQRVTHTGAARNNPGKVVAFSRHPTALATALCAIIELRHPSGAPLRAAERQVLETVVRGADRAGLYWGGVNAIAKLTGLAPQTIRVACRKLRPLGVLAWQWIKAHHKFPARKGYWEGAAWNQGARTRHGGRVFALSWAKLGVVFDVSAPGTGRARLILQDQSGLIPQDQSTIGSSSFGYTDPALGTPPAPTRAPSADAPAPERRENVASETPGEPRPADPCESRGQGAATAPPERDRQRAGDGRRPPDARGAPEAPATPDQVKSMLAWLQSPGLTPPPSVPEHRRPKPRPG